MAFGDKDVGPERLVAFFQCVGVRAVDYDLCVPELLMAADERTDFMYRPVLKMEVQNEAVWKMLRGFPYGFPAGPRGEGFVSRIAENPFQHRQGMPVVFRNENSVAHSLTAYNCTKKAENKKRRQGPGAVQKSGISVPFSTRGLPPFFYSALFIKIDG